MTRAGAALAACLLAALPAAAQAPAPVPVAGDADGFRWGRLELRGRVLARYVSDREEGTSASDFEAENLRLELRWRPARWLRAVVEYDQAEDTHLKDAYLALRPGRFEVRAGQFKPPVSPIEMDSRWNLPVSERGLVSEVLSYSYGICGRRPGAQASWDHGRLSATAGLFRASSVRGDRLGDEAFDNLSKDWGALKATGRLEWSRKRAGLGASFDLRPAEPLPGAGYRRFWTLAVDAAWAARKKGGPRATLEGYLGSTWQDANPFDGVDARFLAGRALAGWRFGRKTRDLFVEPYAMLSALDPDTSVREDLLWEASAGLHAGGLRHLRLVLEAQRRGVSRYAPLALGLLPLGQAPPASRTRLVAQLGASF